MAVLLFGLFLPNDQVISDQLIFRTPAQGCAR
jgi:hypothetical protein